MWGRIHTIVAQRAKVTPYYTSAPCHSPRPPSTRPRLCGGASTLYTARWEPRVSLPRLVFTKNLGWCYVRPRFTIKGQGGKGTLLIPRLPGPLRSHSAATSPLSLASLCLHKFGGPTFHHFNIAALELDNCRIIWNTLPTGNPSSRATARPESPCALNRATSPRCASNVLGLPSLTPRRFAAEKPSWIASTAAACLNSSTASSVLRNTCGASEVLMRPGIIRTTFRLTNSLSTATSSGTLRAIPLKLLASTTSTLPARIALKSTSASLRTRTPSQPR
jgi:hypothetical protein